MNVGEPLLEVAAEGWTVLYTTFSNISTATVIKIPAHYHPT